MSEGWRRSPRLVGALVVLVLSVLLWQYRAKPIVRKERPDDVVETNPIEIGAPRPPPRPKPPPAPPPEPPSREDLVALAGANGVVCEAELPGGTAVGAARLEADLPDGFLGVATVGAGHVVLSEVPDAGEGTLHVEGFAPAALSWGPDGCVPEPVVLEPARGAVTGTVAGADGETTVEVCGRPAILDEEGAFYADAIPGEDCAVRVRRHYGTFQWEEEVVVRPRVGEDAVVEVEAPGPLAVLPLELDGDLRITADWTGAGLTGRRVVALDGQPAPADPVDAHLVVAGPVDATGEGVEVELADGQVVVVELRVASFEDWLLEHP